jgi:hypothetical protein
MPTGGVDSGRVSGDVGGWESPLRMQSLMYSGAEPVKARQNSTERRAHIPNQQVVLCWLDNTRHSVLPRYEFDSRPDLVASLQQASPQRFGTCPPHAVCQAAPQRLIHLSSLPRRVLT